MPKADIFTPLVPKIAKSIIGTITNKHTSDGWVSAVYYNSQAADRSAMGKLRVQLKHGEDASLRPDRDVLDLVYETWEKMFKKSKKGIWYGFKLTVYPDGRHEIEYNYDPNCIDDPTFIDF